MASILNPAASRTTRTGSSAPPKRRRKRLALLLPGHNEELIIATTIRSAIAAGQPAADIYVVDDNSSDRTRAEAVRLLGRKNVLSVERSGKALAVKKALAHFNIQKRYVWVHVADADSLFCPNYFKMYRRKLNAGKYAVAVGFVQSLRGNWISTYRALSYTYGQHVTRRIQSRLGMITVFPGPTTSFKTDILERLDFEADSLTEDFDLTLQVHRKRLGKMLYIPQAINYTQDPQSLADFIKQTARWHRGFFQGVATHHVGLRRQRIDIGIGYQITQVFVYLVQLFIVVPLIIAVTGNWLILPIILAGDYVVTGLSALFSGAIIKRWSLLGVMPYFYFLRWVEIYLFTRSYIEVVWQKKFASSAKGWSTAGRRYKISAEALRDAAAN